MAVRINGPAPLGSVGRPNGRTASKKAEGKQADGDAGASEKVSLSEKEAAVSLASRASKSVNEVDEAKVAELRAAIARGEYRADLKIVAERIIAEAMAFGRD